MRNNLIKTILILAQIILILVVIKQIVRLTDNYVTGEITLDPVDLEDPFLGPEDAEITIIEYSEFQCPFCSAAVGTHPVLVQRLKSQLPEWEAPVPKLEELGVRTGYLVTVDYHC